MKYAGVVVLYNPDDNSIYENICSYLNELDKLYIVDNSDNKENKIKLPKSPKIEYICNKTNLGIAKALNIGAERAINDNFEWLLTMDQDSAFESKQVRKMKDFIEESKNKNKVLKSLDINYEKIGIVAPFYKLADDYSTTFGVVDCLIVMTSGNFINLNIYKKLNGFKNWLFIDCVDFDYCLNLKKNGYSIVQLNNVILKHSLGNTKNYKFLWKNISSSNHSYIRKYYLVRNRHYIYELYHDEFPAYCNLELKQTKKEALKILLFEKDKFRKIKYMIKGYKDYKNGKKGCINEKN